MSYILVSKIINIVLALSALALVVFFVHDWRLVGFILAMISFVELLRHLAGKRALKNLAKLENLKQKFTGSGAREGDVLTVRAGERIPADGTIAEGETLCNEFPLTGSSQQILKRKDDLVYATTINEGGEAGVLVRNVGDKTMIAKMTRAVKELWHCMPSFERKIMAITVFLSVFIVLLAIAARRFSVGGQGVSVALLSVVSLDGIVFLTWQLWKARVSRAALHGVIFKSADALKKLAKFSFVSINPGNQPAHSIKNFSYMRTFWGVADNEVLMLSAIAEKCSDHPLANAILAEAHRKNIKYQSPDAFTMIKGEGVIAEQGGKKIVVGGEKLIRENNIHIQEEIQKHISSELDQGTEIAIVARDGKIIGVLSFSDAKKAELKITISQLKGLGVSEIGARDTVKAAIAVNKAAKEASDFSGDDVNVAADVLGSGVFPEKADVLIMHDSLAMLPKLIIFSRESRAAIRTIFIFMIGLNVAGVALVWWKVFGPYGAVSFRMLSELTAFIFARRLLEKDEDL